MVSFTSCRNQPEFDEAGKCLSVGEDINAVRLRSSWDGQKFDHLGYQLLTHLELKCVRQSREQGREKESGGKKGPSSLQLMTQMTQEKDLISLPGEQNGIWLD